MKHHRLHLLSWLAALALPTHAAFAAPQGDCALLARDEVRAQLGGAYTLLSHDPAGMCSWSSGAMGTLMLNLIRRPVAQEASQVFDAHLAAGRDTGQQPMDAPGLGQRAGFLVSAPDAPMQSLSLIIQDQTDTLTLMLYGASASSEDTRQALATLGRQALARRARADQSFGRCEWFTPAQAESLLGARPQIHRMGALHCSASVGSSSAALVAMSSPGASLEVLKNMKAGTADSCQQVDLPELGEGAFAQHHCAAPGNLALSVYLLVGKRQVNWVLNPGTRPAGAEELKALLPVIQASRPHAESLNP
ncbi:hypothetical protein H5407_20470 [Mitsuaria sp. WAJ17]|uniref:hypothetical protein n=1 Tax=Mitsuaria sp. WAJ17 TaxID=2761452 RepID=UPI0016002DC0|nr:hypothetical protein [Mitsuaria sp. WAJ17]MBB2487617.1 hypothetical protein [Mitsuaria sp. WAJ17]